MSRLGHSKNILYCGLDPLYYPFDPNARVDHLPLIQTSPIHPEHPRIKAAFQNFERYTHLIFTSKTAVSYFFNFLQFYGYSRNDWKKKKHIVIGKVTEKFLNAEGIDNCLVAQEETAEGIVALLSQRDFHGSFFFWAHSALSRMLIQEYLESRGIIHCACPIYETKPIRIQHEIDFSHYDEIIFTSPSVVDAFIDSFQHFPSQVILTPIGSVTRKKIERMKQQ